jgi:hypothetical protein
VNDRVGKNWLAAEIRPRVDSLTVNAPTTIGLNERPKVTASLTQGTRQVPVAYPVSYDWTASPNVLVGDWRDWRPWDIARLDPRTGEITPLWPGTFTVAVTVNGVTQKSTIQIALRKAA